MAGIDTAILAKALLAGADSDVRTPSKWSVRRSWILRGGLAVADQGLISGSNFLLSVLLARWLSAEQYGAYALGFSLFLLVAGFHQALLIEPMSVLGPAVYWDDRRRYIGALIALHTFAGLAISVALGVTALITDRFFPGGVLEQALGGLAVAAPCILLFWLLRNASYVELAPGVSAAGSLLYALILFSGAGVIYRFNLLSVRSVFYLMGFGSLAVCGFLVLRARPLLPTIELTGRVWRDHWDFGRWGLAKTAVEWGGDNSVYALTAVLLKVSDVGALRAMGNLALPLSHISAAVGRLLQPHVSRIAGRDGAGAAKSAVMRALLLYAAGALVYWLVIAISCKPLVRLLYGGKFDSSAYLAPWIALGMAFCVVSYCFAMGLRALQAPSGVLVVATVTAIASVATGIPLAWLFGLKGVVAAQCVASVATISAAWCLFNRRARNQQRDAEEVPVV
jgi:O-antigen/teichoic acid export membrane protein